MRLKDYTCPLTNILLWNNNKTMAASLDTN